MLPVLPGMHADGGLHLRRPRELLGAGFVKSTNFRQRPAEAIYRREAPLMPSFYTCASCNMAQALDRELVVLTQKEQ